MIEQTSALGRRVAIDMPPRSGFVAVLGALNSRGTQTRLAAQLGRLFREKTEHLPVVGRPTIVELDRKRAVIDFEVMPEVERVNLAGVAKRFIAAPIDEARLDEVFALSGHTDREEVRRHIDAWNRVQAEHMTMRAAFQLILDAAQPIPVPEALIELNCIRLSIPRRMQLRDSGAPDWNTRQLNTTRIRPIAEQRGKLELAVRFLRDQLGLQPTDDELATNAIYREIGGQPDCEEAIGDARGQVLVQKIVDWVHRNTVVADVVLPCEAVMP